MHIFFREFDLPAELLISEKQNLLSLHILMAVNRILNNKCGATYNVNSGGRKLEKYLTRIFSLHKYYISHLITTVLLHRIYIV